MKVTVKKEISATREAAWKVLTDIENAINVISGIEELEVLEKGGPDLVGLKWKETRTMFGKTATEVMEIKEAVKNEYYNTWASSHGFEYNTQVFIREEDGRLCIGYTMTGKALTTGGKIMSALIGWMFKGATKKALMKDLEELKAAIES